MTSDSMHTEVINGYTISIWPDPEPPNPREFCTLGTLALQHGRYSLAWEHQGTSARTMRQQCGGWQEVQERIVRDVRQAGDEVVSIKYVYMLDHSSIHLKTSEGRDPFSHVHMGLDSGCVGFVYLTRKGVLSTYQRKHITQGLLDTAAKAMEQEVEDYNTFVGGRACMFEVLDPQGEPIESCGGYFSVAHAVEAAKECLL
jgi:hypothetical protein